MIGRRLLVIKVLASSLLCHQDSFHPIAADNQDADFKAILNKRKAKVYDVEAESFSVVDIQQTRRAEWANTEQVMLLFGLRVSLQSLVHCLMETNCRLYQS